MLYWPVTEVRPRLQQRRRGAVLVGAADDEEAPAGGRRRDVTYNIYCAITQCYSYCAKNTVLYFTILFTVLRMLVLHPYLMNMHSMSPCAMC